MKEKPLCRGGSKQVGKKDKMDLFSIRSPDPLRDKMTLLLELPEELSLEISTQWLGIREWTKLDAAISSVAQRILLRKLFQNIPPVRSSDYYADILMPSSSPCSFYCWALTKGLRLLDLILTDDCCSECGSLFVQSGLCCVDSLFVYTLSHIEVIESIIRSCVNASTFVCRSPVVLTLLSRSQLEQIKILDVLEFDADQVSIIGSMHVVNAHCRSLTSLSLSCEDYYQYPSYLGELVSNNHQLRSVYLPALTPLVDCMVRHCPLMEEIRLYSDQNNVELDFLRVGVLSFLHLRAFEFNSRLLFLADNDRREYKLSSCDSSMDFSFVCDATKIELDTVGLCCNNVVSILHCSYLTLQELQLEDTLSVSCLEKVLPYCGSLTKLSILDCEGMMDLFRPSLTGNLKELNIGDAKLFVSDVQQVLSACPLLRHISVFDVVDLEEGWEALELILRNDCEDGLSAIFSLGRGNIVTFKNGRFVHAQEAFEYRHGGISR